MYKLVRIASLLLRQFVFPNPFTNMFENAEIINLLCGSIFVGLAYYLTGTWYNGGEPFIGSLGFLINYLIITLLLIGISYLFSNVWIIIAIFIILYLLLCFGENKLLGKNYF